MIGGRVNALQNRQRIRRLRSRLTRLEPTPDVIISRWSKEKKEWFDKLNKSLKIGCIFNIRYNTSVWRSVKMIDKNNQTYKIKIKYFTEHDNQDDEWIDILKQYNNKYQIISTNTKSWKLAVFHNKCLTLNRDGYGIYFYSKTKKKPYFVIPQTRYNSKFQLYDIQTDTKNDCGQLPLSIKILITEYPFHDISYALNKKNNLLYAIIGDYLCFASLNLETTEWKIYSNDRNQLANDIETHSFVDEENKIPIVINNELHIFTTPKFGLSKHKLSNHIKYDNNKKQFVVIGIDQKYNMKIQKNVIFVQSVNKIIVSCAHDICICDNDSKYAWKVINNSYESPNAQPHSMVLAFNYLVFIFYNCQREIYCLDLLANEYKIVLCTVKVQGIQYIYQPTNIITNEMANNLHILGNGGSLIHLIPDNIKRSYQIRQNKIVSGYIHNHDSNVQYPSDLLHLIGFYLSFV